jgi:hypothetical protein
VSDKCPKCRHAAHKHGCLNAASDNDCPCGWPSPVPLLTDEEIRDLGEVQRLLDVMYDDYYARSDGYSKLSEGYLGVSFGTYRDRQGEKRHVDVEVYSYVFGKGGRHHYFDSPREAVEAVREWYVEALDRTYEDPWDPGFAI